MTREEAKYMVKIVPDKNKIVKNKIFVWRVDKDFEKRIDEIYDDFESRVCKNCFYYFEETCVCDESPLVTEIVDENYGCNKFKRRENERD